MMMKFYAEETISKEKLAGWKLRNDCLTGLILRYGEKAPEILERLKDELDAIMAMGEWEDEDLFNYPTVAECLGLTKSGL